MSYLDKLIAESGIESWSDCDSAGSLSEPAKLGEKAEEEEDDDNYLKVSFDAGFESQKFVSAKSSSACKAGIPILDASKITITKKKGILVKNSLLGAKQTPVKTIGEETKSPAKTPISTAEKSAKKSVSWDPLLSAKPVKSFFHAEDDANLETIKQGDALNQQIDSDDDEEEEEESDLEDNYNPYKRRKSENGSFNHIERGYGPEAKKREKISSSLSCQRIRVLVKFLLLEQKQVYCELDKNLKSFTDLAFPSLDKQTVSKVKALLSKRISVRAQLNKQLTTFDAFLKKTVFKLPTVELCEVQKNLLSDQYESQIKHAAALKVPQGLVWDEQLMAFIKHELIEQDQIFDKHQDQLIRIIDENEFRQEENIEIKNNVQVIAQGHLKANGVLEEILDSLKTHSWQ